jgi:hypothetical protein
MYGTSNVVQSREREIKLVIKHTFYQVCLADSPAPVNCNQFGFSTLHVIADDGLFMLATYDNAISHCAA